jgi:hypothetical protein
MATVHPVLGQAPASCSTPERQPDRSNLVSQRECRLMFVERSFFSYRVTLVAFEALESTASARGILNKYVWIVHH